MDLSIPVILFLEWGGTALVIWGVWQVAFNGSPTIREEKSIDEEVGLADEIRTLETEVRNL